MGAHQQLVFRVEGPLQAVHVEVYTQAQGVPDRQTAIKARRDPNLETARRGGRRSSVTIAERYEETIPVPRAIRFPVELIPPEGFDPARLDTWPKVDGRLEYVGGRLLYMSLCGDMQQDAVADVVGMLLQWVRAHPGLVVSTNEAGMILRGDARGADAAIFRRADVGRYQHKFRRVPPILAVAVAGEDEDEAVLREKAGWYLARGVEVVWLILPEQREVVAITTDADQRYGVGETLAPHPALPDLTPRVDEFFVQIAAG